jgi:hypothetical protein
VGSSGLGSREQAGGPHFHSPKDWTRQNEDIPRSIGFFSVVGGNRRIGDLKGSGHDLGSDG